MAKTSIFTESTRNAGTYFTNEVDVTAELVAGFDSITFYADVAANQWNTPGRKASLHAEVWNETESRWDHVVGMGMSFEGDPPSGPAPDDRPWVSTEPDDFIGKRMRGVLTIEDRMKIGVSFDLHTRA